MANLHRGEIEARLDGAAHRLVLTLGALAELESAFGDEDMVALAARFERGRLSSRECVKVIAAGLRGAGASISDDDVSRMQADGGVAGFVDIVARLLTATFGGGGGAPASADGASIEGGGAVARGPFLGTT
ncbi:MAG: gene transfer agent family protein [Hyphomicrobium sp.]